MTVESQIPYQSYVANGLQTSFTLSFYVEDKGNFFVKKDETIVSVNDYVYDSITNSITFNTAPLQGCLVEIERVTSTDRSTTYATFNNSFRPEVLNYDIDRIWRKLQELAYTDSVLFLKLIKEIADRISVDSALQEQINTLDNQVILNTENIEQLINNLSQEIANRIQADALLKETFLSIIDTAINEGTVNALAVIHLDSITELDAIQTWEGRTVYIKSFGFYRYDFLTESWLFLDSDLIKTVDSITDLLTLPTWDQRSVIVKSYHNGLSRGGGEFYADKQDTTSTDNGVTVFVAVDGTRWKRKNTVLSFADAGCIGTGDDTESLKRLFNYLAINGGVVEDYSGKTYTFTSDILCTAPNKKITLIGNVKFSSNTSYMTFSGSIEDVGYITSAANINERIINLNNVSALLDNDVIAIHNSRPYSFNNYRDYYFDGEIKEVKSITGNVVTLKNALETNYISGIEDKVSRINPIELIIDGLTFDCNGFAGLRIQFAVNSKFKMDVYNKLNLTNASYAIIFDRVYKSKMIGGKAIKLGLGNTGTDYGIVVANCQDMYIKAEYAYGERHGCAMGGGNVQGAIPNRRIIYESIKIENKSSDGLHTADIHGNAIDCFYKNCVIDGLIGLGGERCYSINNIISIKNTEIRSPIFMTEVSGSVGSIGDTFVDCGAASTLVGWASSFTARVNTKPYGFELKDAKIGKCSSLIGLMNAVTVNGSDSKFIIDGVEFLQSYDSLTRLLTYAESGASGVTVKKPSFIQITNIKNPISESTLLISGDGLLPNITKKLFNQSGSNTNGTWIKQSDGTMLCKHRISTTVAINTVYAGGYKSTDITWNFPKSFVTDPPTIMAINLDNSCISVKALNTTVNNDMC